MAFGITYTVGGTTYNLNGFNAQLNRNIAFIGDIGFGMSPGHRLAERSPIQDGDTDVGFRLDPRVIQLPFAVVVESINEHYPLRQILHRMFRWSTIPGTLTVTFPTGEQRSIVAYINGGLDFNSAGAEWNLRFAVEMRADDPTWFDSTQDIVRMTEYVAGPPTSYPYVIPVTYGALNFDALTTINYTGSFKAFPLIVATGPITNLLIQNLTTGDEIGLTVALAAGTTYTFDLRYGVKTVTDQNGVNRVANLTATSDMTTFCLEAAPEAPDGLNAIYVTATGTTSDSLVNFFFNTRFQGI
jgi:hypothetical protein